MRFCNLSRDEVVRTFKILAIPIDASRRDQLHNQSKMYEHSFEMGQKTIPIWYKYDCA
jgi:hypothetical protein